MEVRVKEAITAAEKRLWEANKATVIRRRTD
jgi:hypothetical protein